MPAISQKDEERTLEYVHLAYAAWQPELFVRINPVPDLAQVEARDLGGYAFGHQQAKS
jgi:hypothetical protein